VDPRHIVDPRNARRALAGAILAGVVIELLLHHVAIGVNVPILTAATLGLIALIGRRGPADPVDWWLPAVAILASLGPALRTDPTVVILDGLLVLGGIAGWALAVGGVPVTRRTTETAVLLFIDSVLAALIGAGMLARRAGADGFLSGELRGLRRGTPVIRGLLLAVPVVGLFTILLASADAVFGRGLEDVLNQSIELDQVTERALFALGAAWLVGGVLALTVGAYRVPGGDTATDQATPAGWIPADGPAPPGATGRRGTTEALTILAAVNVLFAIFAGVQVVFLFGGASTLAAIGMTYSDYARQGYFQLVAVVCFAGLLLVGAHLVVGRTRAFLASSLMLVGLTGVILASAAFRLRLYQEAYGWTEVRFYVAASILWLAVGAAIAMVLIWRDRMRWLAHGLAAGAIAITLGVSLIGPHAFVTRENLARVLDPTLVAPGGRTGFDASYALSLGDDAVPDLVAALGYLPPRERDQVLRDLEWRRTQLATDAKSMGWASWNLARERARQALATLPGR
jgi:Domain of unknown function (DUF4173)